MRTYALLQPDLQRDWGRSDANAARLVTLFYHSYRAHRRAPKEAAWVTHQIPGECGSGTVRAYGPRWQGRGKMSRPRRRALRGMQWPGITATQRTAQQAMKRPIRCAAAVQKGEAAAQAPCARPVAPNARARIRHHRRDFRDLGKRAHIQIHAPRRSRCFAGWRAANARVLSHTFDRPPAANGLESAPQRPRARRTRQKTLHADSGDHSAICL